MVAHNEITILSQNDVNLKCKSMNVLFQIFWVYSSPYTNISQALLINLHSNISFWSLIWGLKFQGSPFSHKMDVI